MAESQGTNAGTGEVTKKARTIVLCFDGTSSEYDGDVGIHGSLRTVVMFILFQSQNTNIVKFFALLKKDDFNEQLCYYQVTCFSARVLN